MPKSRAAQSFLLGFRVQGFHRVCSEIFSGRLSVIQRYQYWPEAPQHVAYKSLLPERDELKDWLRV